MPNVYMVIPNKTKSIRSWVTRQVIKDLMSSRLLPSVKKIRTYDSPIGQSNARPKRAKFAPEDRILVAEAYAEIDRSGGIRASNYSVRRAFLDNQIDFAWDVEYRNVEYTAQYTYSSLSKERVESWVELVWAMISRGKYQFVHNLEYTITLPKELYPLLHEIYDCRENVQGYGDTLAEYIKEHSSQDMTIVSEDTGTLTQLTLRSSHIRNIGMVTTNSKPEIEDVGGGIYKAEISYKLTYPISTGFTVTYPIVVHSQMLDDKFIILSDVSRRNQIGVMSDMQGLTSFEATSTREFLNSHNTIPIPWYDSEYSRSYPTYLYRLFSAIVVPDDMSRKNLLDLKDIAEIDINPYVLEFIMESEYPYMHEVGESILHVAMQTNRHYDNHFDMRCLPDATVNAVEEVNLRNIHRLSLCILVDLSLVSPEAWERLLRYPDALAAIVSSFNDALAIYGYIRDWVGKGKLRPVDLENWQLFVDRYPDIDPDKVPKDPNHVAGYDEGFPYDLTVNTKNIKNISVMTNDIIAYRKEKRWES